MNFCSIWPFAQNSDDFYFLDIWQCARYFVVALFKELALITIREMWGLGLVSKFEPGLGLGGYGLDYIYVAKYSSEWSINKISKLFFTEFNARV